MKQRGVGRSVSLTNVSHPNVGTMSRPPGTGRVHSVQLNVSVGLARWSTTLKRNKIQRNIVRFAVRFLIEGVATATWRWLVSADHEGFAVHDRDNYPHSTPVEPHTFFGGSCTTREGTSPKRQQILRRPVHGKRESVALSCGLPIEAPNANLIENRISGRENMTPTRVLILVVILLVLPAVHCLALPRPEAQVRKQAAQLYRALSSYLSTLHLVPIVLPSNHIPGDVINWTNMVFEDRARTCFPDLVTERHDTALPSIVVDRANNHRLALVFERMIQAATGISGRYSIRIDYLDPYLLETTRKDLLRALDSAKCSYLEPVLNEENLKNVPPLVVGRVVYAQMRIVITSDVESSSRLATDVAKLFLRSASGDPEVLPPSVLDTKASISVNVEAGRSVVVSSATAFPVALAPAFVVEAFLATKGNDVYYEPRSIRFDRTLYSDAFRRNIDAFVEPDSVVGVLWSRSARP